MWKRHTKSILETIDEYNRTQKRKDRLKSIDKYLFELRENEHKKELRNHFMKLLCK